MKSFAFLLAASAALFAPAADGLARPQTTNPAGYFTVRVVVSNKSVTIRPNHGRRGQVAVFLVTNHATIPRVFTLGNVTLTKRRGTGFALKLAANQQKRVLVTLDYRGPLRAAVGTATKTRVVGAFTVV